jgi:CRISPR-associated protein Csm1
LGDVHDPVHRLAEEAGHAEGSAKSNGRKSITLFDTHTVRWEDADRILSLTKEVGGLFRIGDDHLYLPDGSISTAVLYRLLMLAREHKKEEGWILPKLAYMFGRTAPRDKEVAGAWATLKNYAFSNNVNWHHLEVAVLWNLMLMRKGGD